MLRLSFLAATLGFAFWLGSVAAENAAVQNLILGGGYLGVFLFSIINGFNVFVPIVTASFIPALTAAGLATVPVIVLIALGMTIADAIGFLLARVGRTHLPPGSARMVGALERAGARQWSLPLVILGLWAALVPFPTEVIAVPVGLMGYQARVVIPILVLGNLFYVTMVGLGFMSAVAWLV